MMAKSDNQLFDLYRSGLEAFIDLARTSVQGAERLREHQLKCLHEAFSEAGETGRQVGSAKTLEDVVEHNQDRMGKTSQLSTGERRALVAYLRTL